MRLLTTLFILMASSAFAQTPKAFFKSADQFFHNEVHDGKIDYEALSSHAEDLNRLIRYIEGTEIERLPMNYQLAYWLNAYNLYVVNKIAQHYPIDSPNQIKDFYNEPNIVIGKKAYSLNQLRDSILMPIYDDPRLLITLGKGTMSGPPMPSFGYQPEKTDKQIDRQAKRVVNSHGFFKIINKDATVSEFFKLNDNYFKSDSSIITFINQFAKTPIPEDANLNYGLYNWELNDDKSGKNSYAKRNTKILNFTPAVAMNKGKAAINTRVNLGSGSDVYDAKGNALETLTMNRFDLLFDFYYGVLDEPAVNLGMDIAIRSVQYHDGSKSMMSVINVPRSESTRSALTYITPKLKIAPFKRANWLSYEGKFSIAIADTLEIEPYIDDHRLRITNIINVDFPLMPNMKIFASVFHQIQLPLFDKQGPLSSFGVNLRPNYYITRQIRAGVGVWMRSNTYTPSEFVAARNESFTFGEVNVTYQATGNVDIQLGYNQVLSAKSYYDLDRYLQLTIRYIP